jgi:hypothetical protein
MMRFPLCVRMLFVVCVSLFVQGRCCIAGDLPFPVLRFLAYYDQLKTCEYDSSSMGIDESQFDDPSLTVLDSDEPTYQGKIVVDFKNFRERFDSQPTSSEPNQYHCDLRVRIGSLMGENDYWWVVAHNKDNEKVRQEFANNFTEHAVPWIERFKDLNDIYHYFLKKRQYFDAAVAAFVLEMDNVESLIQKAISHAPHDNFGRFVQAWARDHGIAT